MSVIVNMSEEKQMLEYLKAKGIKTFAQLEAIFKHFQSETVDEEVAFVKEIAAPCITQEKIDLLIEASMRNKEKLLEDLSKGVSIAEITKPEERSEGVQTSVIVDPNPCVVNVACRGKKIVTTLPTRYRRKYIHLNNPYPKQTRSQQQREKNHQAKAKQINNKKMALGVNIQYHQFNQCTQYSPQRQLNQSMQNQFYQSTQNQFNQCTPSQLNQCNQYNQLTQQQNYNANTLSHHTYLGVGQNIGTGYNNATPIGFANPIGHNISITQPLVSSNPVYNALQQQQWPITMPMTNSNTGQANFGQFELGSQVQHQPPCAPYVMGNRPIFDPN